MKDNKKKGALTSSFAYPLHEATKTTSTFSVSSDIHTDVDKKWLMETSSQAASLGTQRSNLELFCLFTCFNKAKELESAGKDGPQDGNMDWIQNINQWAANNTTLAKQSGYVVAYFKKYGFAMYQNVASDRLFFCLRSVCVLY
jgi:hypothetical protein